jgi:glutamate-1-semialdehyde 2,1-aminomutase
MFGFYFSAEIPQSFEEVKAANQERFKRFFHLMLADGVFLAPSMFEAGFVCIKHDAQALEQTLVSAKRAFAVLI